MHFFSVYKMLEGKETIVKELCGRDTAIEITDKCIKAYREKFGDEGEQKTIKNPADLQEIYKAINPTRVFVG